MCAGELGDGQGRDLLNLLKHPLLVTGCLIEPPGHRQRFLHHLGRLGPDESFIGVGVVLFFVFSTLGPLEALLLGRSEPLDVGM